MLRFAPNLTMLFTEVPFLDRFSLAAQAGAREIEFLFPYEYQPQQLAEQLQKHGLKQVLFNLPAGDWAAGERGIAANPSKVDDFRAGVHRALEYAAVLQVPTLNCLAGLALPDVDAAEQRRTLVENIRYAATACAQREIRLVVEGINHLDMKGFNLNTAPRFCRCWMKPDIPTHSCNMTCFTPAAKRKTFRPF